jgi:hypothetical protein
MLCGSLSQIIWTRITSSVKEIPTRLKAEQCSRMQHSHWCRMLGYTTLKLNFVLSSCLDMSTGVNNQCSWVCSEDSHSDCWPLWPVSVHGILKELNLKLLHLFLRIRFWWYLFHPAGKSYKRQLPNENVTSSCMIASVVFSQRSRVVIPAGGPRFHLDPFVYHKWSNKRWLVTWCS